jgi:RecA-family ATPase
MMTPQGLKDCLPETSGHMNGEEPNPSMASNIITKALWDAGRLREYEPVPREWVVPGCIPCGEVTLLTGPGGLGKSILAIQLQVAMSAGVEWLGYETLQVPSLGLYAEEDQDELARRFQTVRRRMGVSWEDMARAVYAPLKGQEVLLTEIDRRDGWVDPSDLLLEIARLIDLLGLRLVVIDSLNRFYHGNENDRPMVTAFLLALEAVATKAQCAILLLAHPSKSAMVDGSLYSGVTSWDSMVRARAGLTYVVPPNPELLTDAEKAQPLLKLAWKKANYSGKGGDIELEMSFAKDAEGEPPIFERVPEDVRENRALFLDIIDRLNADGEHPRASDKGRSKALYAPTAVYLHPLNKRRQGAHPMTAAQCVNLYSDLLSNLGMLRVAVAKDAARHIIEVVERVPGLESEGEKYQDEIQF